jgi:hypothetical protein
LLNASFLLDHNRTRKQSLILLIFRQCRFGGGVQKKIIGAELGSAGVHAGGGLKKTFMKYSE